MDFLSSRSMVYCAGLESTARLAAMPPRANAAVKAAMAEPPIAGPAPRTAKSGPGQILRATGAQVSFLLLLDDRGQ